MPDIAFHGWLRGYIVLHKALDGGGLYIAYYPDQF